MNKEIKFKFHLYNFITIIFIIFYFSSISYAAEIELKDHILFYNISIDTSTSPSISIKWKTTDDTKNIRIAKKRKTDDSFGNYQAFITDKTINEWKDSNVVKGIEYEYSIEQFKDSCSAYAFFSAGIDIPLIEYRGRILLLIDSTVYEPLYNEINKLIEDICGDGWQVQIRLTPRAETFNKDKVEIVKNIILEELNHPDSLRTIFLIGRVPVPYSGNYATDGHIPEHCGAWPCDGFYQSFAKTMNDTSVYKWTDSKVTSTIAEDERNWNIIDDGKFDNDLFPRNLTLECGRVDMYNLPLFKKDEIELLKQYFNQNHLYRNNLLNFKKNAIINDYFGMYSKYEVFAANGWMNAISLFGQNNIDTFDFKTALLHDKYLFSYASGPGSYTACQNAVSTEYLASEGGYNTIFSFLFGSWFGDWDNKNNLMRSMLAATPPALTCSWSARPYWYIHQMAFTETIGYSALLTQNNSSFGTYISNSQRGHKGIHISLLGDPTLRINNITPITDANAVFDMNDNTQPPYIKLSWKYDDKEIEGFNIYKAKSMFDKFTRINSEIIKDYEIIDNNIFLDSVIYQIRVVKKETSINGTYYNQSIGKFITVPTISIPSKENTITACVIPNPVQDYINLVVSALPNKLLTISLYDLLGNNYGEIYNNILNDSDILIRFNINSISSLTNNLNISSGTYYLVLNQDDKKLILPIVISR